MTRGARRGLLLPGLCGLALGLCGLAAAAGAEEQQASHIVRPGDTLRGLTRLHLGSEDRWEENWRLNPGIANPDLLIPGQRIRILVARAESPVPTARVIMVSGDRAEERPAPVDWLGAQSDDLLLEKDGLRTGPASSMALRFTDGTQLALTEGSRVFLARAGRSLEGVDERSVEILEGQAELAAIEPRVPAADIEIVIGGAVAKPASGAAGELQARARKQEAGGAAVMMYEGRGEVEAAGETVAVERGMGTAVPEAGPPAPPEKLLPAPEPLRPAASTRLPYPDPEFAWNAVPGASSYTLELCSDAECLQAFRRQTGLAGTAWRSPPLPVAAHYWRVTAVSPSGLDGYPGEPLAFTVLSDRRDEEAPVVSFELDGPRVAANGVVHYAPSAAVEVVVTDEPAGVASWRPLIDGRPATADELAGGWSGGVHEVAVSAVDRLGNEGQTAGPRFTVDAEAPRLVWQAAGGETVDRVLAAVDEPERWRRRWRSWQKRARRALAAESADPALWALVAWETDALSSVGASWSPRTLRWGERRRHQTVTHAGGSPAVVLVAPRLVPPGRDEPLGDEMIVLRAVDDGAGARALSLRTVAAAGGPALEIAAVDRLGNRRIERAPFAGR